MMDSRPRPKSAPSRPSGFSIDWIGCPAPTGKIIPALAAASQNVWSAVALKRPFTVKVPIEPSVVGEALPTGWALSANANAAGHLPVAFPIGMLLGDPGIVH